MLVGLFLTLFVAYLFYVLVLPQIELGLYQLQNPKRKTLPPGFEMKWTNRFLLRTCEFLFVGWFFYFGASIGSFLNVVAHRVPEGRTIVFGGSKCPYCDTHLGFIDNTPVLGWLYLQAKCRTCRLPIAPRYLLIEVATGLTFMWLALWELVRGGTNLANWNFTGRAGVVNTILDPSWPLIGIYVVHAAMFGVMIMLATANVGRKPFPIFSLIVIALALASSKIVNPQLDLVAWYRPFAESGLNGIGPFGNPACSILIGGLLGGVIGWLSSHVFARRFGTIVGRHWSLQCILVGSVLGWQSVLTIVVLSLIVYGALRWGFRLLQSRPSSVSLSNQSIGLNACLIGTALVYLSFWSPISRFLGLC